MFIPQTFRQLLKMQPSTGPLEKETVNPMVSGIQSDSRRVRPGDLFCACVEDGDIARGAMYIAEAIEKGAVVVLLENTELLAKLIAPIWCPDSGQFESSALSQLVNPKNVPIVYLLKLKDTIGLLASQGHGEPSKDLAVYGVTGTNGKTTVSYLLAQILARSGQRSGLIGTLGAGVWGDLKSTGMTTPDACRLQELLADFRDSGLKAVAMEVSSHALDQGRVSGVSFDVALFTNLSRDHLDYHETMDAYAAAKELLFQMHDLKYAVLNADDAVGRRYWEWLPKTVQGVRYGLLDPASEIYASDIRYSMRGTEFRVKTPWGEGGVHVPLLGIFNIENSLAVLGGLCVMGMSFEEACHQLSQVEAPPGRLQVIEGQGKRVVVDYAHTPDALRAALSCVKQHAEGRVICVFGCGGDRDKGKRSLMGAEAGRWADELIVTNDNPRSEDPELIAEKIVAGVKGTKPVEVILERAKAIEMAVSRAKPGDWVLVAGKGHEDTQEIGGQCYPCNDAEIARGVLGG